MGIKYLRESIEPGQQRAIIGTKIVRLSYCGTEVPILRKDIKDRH